MPSNIPLTNILFRNYHFKFTLISYPSLTIRNFLISKAFAISIDCSRLPSISLFIRLDKVDCFKPVFSQTSFWLTFAFRNTSLIGCVSMFYKF